MLQLFSLLCEGYKNCEDTVIGYTWLQPCSTVNSYRYNHGYNNALISLVLNVRVKLPGRELFSRSLVSNHDFSTPYPWGARHKELHILPHFLHLFPMTLEFMNVK